MIINSHPSSLILQIKKLKGEYIYYINCTPFCTCRENQTLIFVQNNWEEMIAQNNSV